ncbi:sulfurtransferase TusA family protein [Pedococcus sp.]|uniref:sulfurtransferase TusA family protein n=1 Tax=Pedococcus sp. TaxID=2860345 RepID=UPI002E1246EC|nr:sulfurtransferase TusA family protein [Pedococcus sp.]
MTSSPGPDAFASAPDAVVDARGLRCPLPVIRLAAHARSVGGVEVVEVLATDPAARSDIPAWCRLRGQEYLGALDRAADGGVAEGGGHTAYRVRITPADAEGRTAAEAAAARPGGAPDRPAG